MRRSSFITVDTRSGGDRVQHHAQRRCRRFSAAQPRNLCGRRCAGAGTLPAALQRAVADSGGGGQITLGGPSPLASPFLRVPELLPRLVRFFNRHPSLSYRLRARLRRQQRAIGTGRRAWCDACTNWRWACTCWRSSRTNSPNCCGAAWIPFLCDAVGNSHRAEINIEKLWNPNLGSAAACRGWSSFVRCACSRRPSGPPRWPVCCAPSSPCWPPAATTLPLIDWGRELHERFALPFYLEQDLLEVLAALQAAGLDLGPAAARRAAARRVPPLGPGQPARLHAGDPARAGVLAAGR